MSRVAVRCLSTTARRCASVQTTAASRVTSAAAASSGVIQIDRPTDLNAPNKRPGSRKAHLHAKYVHLVNNHKDSLLLFAQHNNLRQSEWNALRASLAKQVPGSKVTVLRSGIFDHAMRVAQVVSKETSLGVNSRGAADLARELKEKHAPDAEAGAQQLDLRNVLGGPLCALTVPLDAQGSDSGTLKRILKLADATNGRLLVLGGAFSGVTFDRPSLDKVAALPPLDTLRAQLVGLLNYAAGGQLVGVLGAPARQAYRTLEGRRLALESESTDPGA
ncbi:hypothetical protein PYCC9005_001491 [Savitreella phatthalungensis]